MDSTETTNDYNNYSDKMYRAEQNLFIRRFP